MKLAIAHVNETPVAPSQRTEVTVPAPLEGIIMACLAKRPADRPPSAADLGDRLRATGLADAWTQARAQDWWQLHHPLSDECRPDEAETRPGLLRPTGSNDWSAS